MQITLYRRSYPVAGSPVSLSFVADHPGQRHTYTAAGEVHRAKQKPLSVVVPDGATVDELRRVLRWQSRTGAVTSTAQEVFDLAKAGDRGFRLGKS